MVNLCPKYRAKKIGMPRYAVRKEFVFHMPLKKTLNPDRSIRRVKIAMFAYDRCG